MLLAALPLALQPIQPPSAFVGVDVVDVENGTIIEDRTVLVENNHITAITAADAPIPEGTQLIQGGGRYLMPGLADMHVHSTNTDWFPLFIAEGVTTVRVMWGRPFLLDLRDEIRAGDLIGPDMMIAGAVIGGPPTMYASAVAYTDPAEARAEVARQAAAGYDFIKIVANLSPDVYAAIVDESARQGLRFAGHVSDDIGIERMIADRIQSIEHWNGFDAVELADEYKERRGKARLLRSGEVALDTMYPPERRARLVAALKNAEVAIVPTMSVWEGERLSCAEHEARMARPELRYVRRFHHDWWATKSPCPTGSPEDLARLDSKAFEAVEAADLRALIDADALLLSGSDSANPHILPAIGLHEEIALMVKRGLTPAEALRTSTINVARFLGEDDSQRRIAVGAQADLLLLTANPLDDIANTRAIHGVMIDGRWLNPASLHAFKDWTAQAVAQSSAAE
ncbi:amidohydrolase family protein [Sphingomicrobium arenosum]|uniref:amidohydrolase family protein n=1 Tax=Sphingomicrobium arenosum TaxID=2233861 RepID=UPI00223EFAD2|nr:amidohydrolase family protein [Sphingomicrobium arenosum]